jgi:TetR/AcrR family transcriptional repressor of nem operon
VHYHFSTKEDLAVAVARNYTNKFIASLGDPAELHGQGKHPVRLYVNAFRNAIEEDKGMCLCGMLAAEIDVLPEAVIKETRDFFHRNIDWLKGAYEVTGNQRGAHELAVNTLCVLEGAMITCKAMDDIALFDTATRSIGSLGKD